jgi:hypothetical protein
MTRLLPKFTSRDEAELRAFCASCGISAETTERAIKLRRKPFAASKPVVGRAKKRRATKASA